MFVFHYKDKDTNYDYPDVKRFFMFRTELHAIVVLLLWHLVHQVSASECELACSKYLCMFVTSTKTRVLKASVYGEE